MTSAAINRIDHTAIVVANIDEAIPRWTMLTGAELRDRKRIPEQGVEVAMLGVGDTLLELISPLEMSSSVARFLEKRGESFHHIGLGVFDIHAAIANLQAQGLEFIDPEPRSGAHGLISFIHPKSSGGVLVELVQKPS